MKWKNQFAFSTLFIFLFIQVNLIAQVAWQQGTAWADGISNITTVNCIGNCHEFSVSNIPLNNHSGTDRGYFYTWFYSDGRVESGSLAPGLTQLTTTGHTFEVNGPIDVTLQLTPKYTDKDKPKLMRTVPGINTPGTINNAIPSATKPISIIPTLEPKKGDTVLYIISYENICSSSNDIFAGNITFSVVDTNQAEILDIYYFHMVNEEPFPNFNPTDSTRKIKIKNDVPTGEKRQVFVEIKFSDTLRLGEEVKLKAVWDLEEYFGCMDSSGAGDPAVPTVLVDILTQSTVKSHDPNQITADQDSVCPDPSRRVDSLIYTIVFQNIGTGPATEVMVRNFIPEPFIPGSINVLEPNGLVSNIDEINREVEWILTQSNGLLENNYQTHKLQGTGDSQYSTPEMEHFTIDSIRFSIKFRDGIVLPPCSSIANRAEIIFDNNPSIFTNDYITRVKCTGCSPCNYSSTIYQLDPLEYDGTYPVNLMVPNQQYDTIVWYPTSGINDLNSNNPTASPSEDITYTATVIKGCSRKIYQIPVLVKSPLCSDCCKEIPFYYWLWALVAFLIFLILLCCVIYYLRRILNVERKIIT